MTIRWGLPARSELARSVPGLKAIGIADPTHTDPRHLKAVAAQIEQHRQQIVGLKAYLGYLRFGPEDPNYALTTGWRRHIIFPSSFTLVTRGRRRRRLNMLILYEWMRSPSTIRTCDS